MQTVLRLRDEIEDYDEDLRRIEDLLKVNPNLRPQAAQTLRDLEARRDELRRELDALLGRSDTGQVAALKGKGLELQRELDALKISLGAKAHPLAHGPPLLALKI